MAAHETSRTGSMEDFLPVIASVIQDELSRPEVKAEVLAPLLRWLAWHIVPYAAVLVLLNLFLTLAGMALMLYLFSPSRR